MKQFSDRIFKIFTNCSLSRTLSTGEQEALLSKAVPQLHPSAEAVHLGSGAMRNPGDGGDSWRAAIWRCAPGSWCPAGDSPEACTFSYLHMNASVFPRLTLKYSTGTSEPQGNTLLGHWELLVWHEGDAVSDVSVLLSGFISGSAMLSWEVRGMPLPPQSLRYLWWSSLSSKTMVPPTRSTLTKNGNWNEYFFLLKQQTILIYLKIVVNLKFNFIYLNTRVLIIR